jgi:hypothetical protein
VVGKNGVARVIRGFQTPHRVLLVTDASAKLTVLRVPDAFGTWRRAELVRS